MLLQIRNDGTILFNKVCDSVELYGIAGNKVGSAKNTNSLVVDYLPAGIYVVKVVAEGEISTQKVMIKWCNNSNFSYFGFREMSDSVKSRSSSFYIDLIANRHL